MSRLKKVRQLVAVLTGIIMMIFSLVMIAKYTMRWVNPHIVFTSSPEFIQDTTGILDDTSKSWLENQIRTRSKETNVAVVLDVQQVKFEVPESYVDEVISRAVENVYNSQKYLVVTYFADAKEAVVRTNIDQNGIASKTIEGVNDIEELSKEVSYLTLKLTDKMKPVKMDLTKEQKQKQAGMLTISIVVFILGLNIVILNMSKSKRSVSGAVVSTPVSGENE
ncbi:MAG: hypothetical protein Q4D02_06545 [Clostridia bacterium]|nr:hypothetical protein [Clostridia bacterium]